MRHMYNLGFGLLMAGLMACAGPVATTAPVRSTPTVNTRLGDKSLEDLTQETHNEINNYRRKKGLAPLQWLDAAAMQALIHSRNIASGKVPFSHQGFDDRVAAIRKEVSGVYGFAENVAEGYMDAKEVTEGWVNSPGHKKNIEGNYNYAGIGIAKARNGDLIYTQVFVYKK